MAFATSNLVVRNGGSTRIVTGNWSCSAGDTPGTLQIGAGGIVDAQFDPNTTTSPSEIPMVSASSASGLTTLTVYHHQTVSNGRFRVEY